MANASFPASLPQAPLIGMVEEIQPTTVSSEVDSGSPKVRRRFTGRWIKWRISMVMTKAQVATFTEFYWDTLKAGTLRFDWKHPRTRNNLTDIRFAVGEKPPTFTAITDNEYEVVFSVEAQGATLS